MDKTCALCGEPGHHSHECKRLRDIELVQAGIDAAKEACKQVGAAHGSAFASHECPAAIEALDPAAIAATAQLPAVEALLTKPVSIGGVRFHAGVKVSHVLRAAERRFEYEQSPEYKAEQAERAADFMAELRRIVPPPSQVPAGEAVAVEFFAYDSECGFETFKTEAEAKKYAQDSIDSYREDAAEGWPEEVENVRWGVVLGSTKEVPLTDNDGNATDWAGDKYVDYVLTERTAPPAQAVAAELSVFSHPTFEGGDIVLVPRGLLAAACSAIDKKREAPKVLAMLREAAMGNAAPPAQAAPDEAVSILDAVITDLEGGFVRCERCGDQEDTKDLDCMGQLHQLRALLAASPPPEVKQEGDRE